MKYVKLGGAGIKVSELCLGTMVFGSAADEKQSLQIIDRAIDDGINFSLTLPMVTITESRKLSLVRLLKVKEKTWCL